MKNVSTAIEVINLSKSFKIPLEKGRSVKNKLLGKNKKGYVEVTPLKGISFTINKGDFFGIVGRNGSGKSTLLKTIAGIYEPTKGRIHVDGKVVPFIELGVGFNPELSGRDNVYLNMALLGFNREETTKLYDDIVDFAELHDFMEEKLMNYSSGMQVRLAFSIAIRADTDILLLDEVLAVGDSAFQRKCYAYFSELKRNHKTVVLVTHSMDSVQQFCTKAVLIDDGHIVSIGNPATVAQKYREMFIVEEDLEEDESNPDEKTVVKKQPVEIKATSHRKDGEILYKVSLTPHKNIQDAVLTLFLDRDNGEQAYRFSVDENTGKKINFQKGKTVKLTLSLQDIFPNGTFSLRASIKSSDRTKEFMSVGDLAKIKIDRQSESNSEWDIHWQPAQKFKIET